MISFIVPAYNASGTIADTLESLRRQTVDCEVIVVDDGSTDDTAAVAATFRSVRVVSQANTGLAGARNAGAALARGDALCFLDADDVVRPTFAERMLEALGPHDLCSCAHEMAGASLESLGWVSRPGNVDMQVDRMLGVNPFVVGGVVLRRDAPRRLGIEPLFDGSLPVHEDWDAWIRLTRAGAQWAPIVDEPLFVYRLRSDSMSCDLDLMWRVGLRVIGRSGADLPAQAYGRRCWTVRSLARAVARADRTLASGLSQFLGDLSESEIGLLASSLRWALQREDIVGPSRVHARSEAWRSRVRSTIPTPLTARILERLDLTSRDWPALARSILALSGPDDRIVLYGLGRNGRLLMSELTMLPDFGNAAFIDDDPQVMIDGAARIDVGDLTRHDLVVVTPDDSAAVVQRLQAHDRVLTLADLAPRARASA